MKMKAVAVTWLVATAGMVLPASAAEPSTVMSNPIPSGTYQVQVASVTSQPTTPLAAATPADEATIVRSNPPIRWSAISGEVKHVDQANRMVEIELTGTEYRVSIPVQENRVGVYKNGDHRYALKDIEPGDNVTVRNLSTNL
jgi:hypothetical protein